MKIATFNANSIRARKHIILPWLEKEGPDVLCIQETKVQDKDFPAGDYGEIGYHAVYRGQKSYNGVAVLSRHEPQNVRFGFDDGDELAEPRMIVLEYVGVTIINNYVPQGYSPDSEKFLYKLEWFRRIRSFLQKHFSTDQPLVWLGDLNIAPEPMDVYDPENLIGHVCYHPDVHELLRSAVDWGLVDVFRKHNREPDHYTFWDYRIPNAVKRKMGWRIDHIYASEALAERSVDAWIDVQPRLLKKPSDHTFLVAEFVVP